MQVSPLPDSVLGSARRSQLLDSHPDEAYDRLELELRDGQAWLRVRDQGAGSTFIGVLPV